MSLESLRNHRSAWNGLKFSESTDEEWGTCDANAVRRLDILYQLQYDRRDEDEELIRFLFSEEIIARQRDSFQGIGDALDLGAFLLARFKRESDIVLFIDAKFANFDTGCGFDREYVYWPLRQATYKYIQDYLPESISRFGPLECNEYDLDEWWEEKNIAWPEREDPTNHFELYDRALNLRKLQDARRHLEDWECSAEDSPEKYCTLRYAYKNLKLYPEACRALENCFPRSDSLWDQTSHQASHLEMYTLAEEWENVRVTVERIDRLFEQFSTWQNIGLGREIISNAFEASSRVGDSVLGPSIFKVCGPLANPLLWAFARVPETCERCCSEMEPARSWCIRS